MVRFLFSILVTFILLKVGRNVRLHGVPAHFYYNLLEKALETDPTEEELRSRLEGIDDTFERLRQHKKILRTKQMGRDLESDSCRDYFFAIGEVHERRVVAKAFDMAHQENLMNYAITAHYSQRTSHVSRRCKNNVECNYVELCELVREAEASQLTRDRLDELNNILSDGVEKSKALREQVAESLETARTIQEKLLEREKFLVEIRAFFGEGPLWIIWEHVQWIFDLILDLIIEQLLRFEAFLVGEG